MMKEIDLNNNIPKHLYSYSNRFVVSWWGNNLYFNYEQIKIGDIEIMTFAYDSSG